MLINNIVASEYIITENFHEAKTWKKAYIGKSTNPKELLLYQWSSQFDTSASITISETILLD